SRGKGVLGHLAEHGHELFDVFWLDVGRVDFIDGGRTALSYAARGGHTAAVKTLLEMGAKVDVDAKDNDGRRPLLWAAVNGHEAVVKLLKSVK
ncbi:hypothetical protein C8A05DRAFT_14717, partial [Staphylotrichum tortipilum]